MEWPLPVLPPTALNMGYVSRHGHRGILWLLPSYLLVLSSLLSVSSTRRAAVYYVLTETRFLFFLGTQLDCIPSLPRS